MLHIAKQSLAGGVSSSMNLNDDPPGFFDHAEGSRIYDVNGNEYIDYVMGAGPLILGHSPQPVIDAVKVQLGTGILYGGDCGLSVEVSERLVELIPCADLVRFTNSGSEAIHVALRLARAYTGRNRIIRFEGHYHGWFDNIFTITAPSLESIGPRQVRSPKPGTMGQGRALDDVLILPWNDLALFSDAVAAHKDHIAGVVMVPIMFGPGAGAFPTNGYLEGVRDICTRHGIVLVFDEIITGFRVALGGAQELFGVQPDLAVYAKAIAAGFPLGAVAGRREIMALISSGEVMHAGTYNGNPICLAASRATLNELAKDNGRFYQRCSDLRCRLTDGIQMAAARHRIPVHLTGAGAIMQVWFTEAPGFHDYRTSRNGHNGKRQARWERSLLEHGVRVHPHKFITSAHSEEDIDLTLKAVEEVMTFL